jgi:hypothetical protein
VIQPDRLVDDFSRKAEAAVRVGRRAHARNPAIGADLCQPDSTSQTLPNTSVKDRALAMLKARHLERRENYVRELTALIERTQ